MSSVVEIYTQHYVVKLTTNEIWSTYMYMYLVIGCLIIFIDSLNLYFFPGVHIFYSIRGYSRMYFLTWFVFSSPNICNEFTMLEFTGVLYKAPIMKTLCIFFVTSYLRQYKLRSVKPSRHLRSSDYSLRNSQGSYDNDFPTWVRLD